MSAVDDYRELVSDLSEVYEPKEVMEFADAALTKLEAERDAALLLLFAAKAMDPSSPGARQLVDDIRKRAGQPREEGGG